MAAIESTNTAPFGAITVLRVTTLVEDAVGALRAWNMRRRTLNELSKLSRAQLSDIGLEGVAFEDVVRGLRR